MGGYGAIIPTLFAVLLFLHLNVSHTVHTTTITNNSKFESQKDCDSKIGIASLTDK